MPAAQLISAGLERAINQLLALDPNAASSLKSLRAKQLRVELTELPWPIVFNFSDRVDVLIDTTHGKQQVDCSLSLSLVTLQKLKDPSQITRLIQQQALVLEGDIHVAQGFSQLITQLEIDWEEQLSKYTGDVLAHTVFQTVNRTALKTTEVFGRLARTFSEGMIEEKQVAAHAILVTNFCDQVSHLRSDTARLEARLALLEQPSSHEDNHLT